MRKLFMMPTPKEAELNDTNSINQIVLHLAKLLPQYGWEITENQHEADLLVAHAGQTHGYGACDVAHCHGLYPTGHHPENAAWFAINKNVLKNLAQAKVVTVPSNWVGKLIERNMGFSPEVVPWAIDFDEWASSSHEGYTLWNKTRNSAVCDPSHVTELANAIPSARFVTTFADETQPVPGNIQTIGIKPFDEMKEVISKSAVYLATTPETFGIGILEAMACGIPILGFEHGAVPDYVEHGVTGFLAKPGDTQALIDGWHYCMSHRAILGKNARAKAKEYTWDRTAQAFALLYDRVYQEKQKVREIVISVVIPNYNYGKFLPDALSSVLAQELTVPYELIVVDDGSTDNSHDILHKLLEQYDNDHYHNLQKCTVIFQDNQGVAAARNAGIAQAKGEYVVCLDADDMFGSPKFLSILYNAIETDPSLGIVYTGLGIITPEDISRYAPSNWPARFDVGAHYRGQNQIPTCNMFRKEAWQRAGGYKFYATPSEDAELWTRIFELGYTARQATKEPLFYYRWHAHSLSSGIRDRGDVAVNWLYFYGAAQKGDHLAGSIAPSKHGSHPVYNTDRPQISVIIPVSEAHLPLLKRALDSVWGQTYPFWECFVVNDTGRDITQYVYPWVTVVTPDKPTGRPSSARNLGIKASTAPMVTFLDADDYFAPTFFEKTLLYYRRYGKYVYTDWVSLKIDGTREVGYSAEYDPNEVFQKPILHTINILIPRKWLDAVGGFDEDMDTWEDIELFMSLASKGLCGQRCPEPLIHYDYSSGTLREYAFTKENELKRYLSDRYGEYMGENAMGCSCQTPPKEASAEELIQAALRGDMIRITYNGASAKTTVIGTATKQNYRRRQKGDIFYVWLEDYQRQPEKFIPTPTESFAVPETTEMPPPPK